MDKIFNCCTTSFRFFLISITFFFLESSSVYAENKADLFHTLTSNKANCALPITIVNTINLSATCIYFETVNITSSNTVLDCNGALIDASNLDFGIRIGGKSKLENVIVKNCKIYGSKRSAIEVRFNYDKSEVIRKTANDLYSLAPNKVKIDNVSIYYPDDHGIYVGEYTQNFTLENSLVYAYYNLAIYLDYNSLQGKIINNKFIVPEGNERTPKREAIAVDSSRFNAIEKNTFTGYMPGGILLYKNCQEHVSTDSSSPVRIHGSDGNKIGYNSFTDVNVGVWIASRQSKNMESADCGDPYYGGRVYVIDHATNNDVFGNTFMRSSLAIIVEDDNNNISYNKLSGRVECLRVGSKPRFELLHKPVIDVYQKNNTCDLQNKNGHSFNYIFGSAP